MAPEQLRTREYGKPSDVWSFGITTWEIVTGRTPYDGKSLMDVGIQIRDKGKTPHIPSGCNPTLKILMKICWNFVPENRPSFKIIIKFLKDNAVTPKIENMIRKYSRKITVPDARVYSSAKLSLSKN